VLKVERLRKSFGGVVATADVSIDFPSGSLSAVIGPNGAGKTTFFNLISGALRPDSGRVLLDGEDLVGLSEAAIVRKGIGLHRQQKLLRARGNVLPVQRRAHAPVLRQARVRVRHVAPVDHVLAQQLELRAATA